jgi:hypothetical protein
LQRSDEIILGTQPITRHPQGNGIDPFAAEQQVDGDGVRLPLSGQTGVGLCE